MKRKELLRHLQDHGCVFVREGGSHSWWMNTSQNIECEIIHVGNQAVRGCIACGQCGKNKNEKCVLQGDGVNDWIQKIKDADGLILGSPVYYSAIAGTMKCFLDRAFYVSGSNGGLFRHKVGVSVVAD